MFIYIKAKIKNTSFTQVILKDSQATFTVDLHCLHLDFGFKKNDCLLLPYNSWSYQGNR